jgi:TRAP-type C4-dicarboxylate transport system permease small subunit
MVAVQNALPAERLGISTAGLRYLGQLGASLGIAIVGTAISSSVSGDLMNHLPTTTVSKMALSAALQHGFIAVLIFALIAVVATFFLKDVPLKATQERLEIERAELADEEHDKELVNV